MLTLKAKILSFIFYPLLVLCWLYILYWIMDMPMDLLSTLVVLVGVTLLEFFVIRSRQNLYKLIAPPESKEHIISVLNDIGYTKVIESKNSIRVVRPSPNPLKEKEVYVKNIGTTFEVLLPEDNVSAFEGINGIQFIGN